MEDPMLDREIINHYSNQRLSNRRLEMLLAETQAVREKNQELNSERVSAQSEKVTLVTRLYQKLRFNSPNPGSPYRRAFAAVCLLFGLAWFSAGNLFNDNSGSKTNSHLASLMLREAALNHQSKLQVEYNDSDIVALAQSMERLDFELKVPEKFADSHTLLGGRYCTLAGNLAVHLRLQPNHVNTSVTGNGLDLGVDEADHVAERSVIDERSVFVTLANEELAALGNVNHVFPDKVSVNSWQQGKLFYLIAESSSR